MRADAKACSSLPAKDGLADERAGRIPTMELLIGGGVRGADGVGAIRLAWRRRPRRPPSEKAASNRRGDGVVDAGRAVDGDAGMSGPSGRRSMRAEPGGRLGERCLERNGECWGNRLGDVADDHATRRAAS